MHAETVDLIDRVRSYGDREVSLTLSDRVIGALMRRSFRNLFDRARADGVTVELDERRGLLESSFTVRMHGRARAMLPTLINWYDCAEACDPTVETP